MAGCAWVRKCFLFSVPLVVTIATPWSQCTAGDESRCLVHQGHCADGWLGAKKTKTFPSVTGCYQYCLSMVECGYISYDASTKRCATYASEQRCSADGDQRFNQFKSYAVRMIALPATYSYQRLHSGSCRDGWLDGQNIKAAATVDACADWCAGHYICRFFSYNPSTNFCSLYSAYGKCGGDGSQSNFASYVLLQDGETAAFTCPAIKPYFYHNAGECASAAPGYTFKKSTLSTCANACYAVQSSCKFFSFSVSSGDCSLFNACGTIKQAGTGVLSYKISNPCTDAPTTTTTTVAR